MKTFSIKLIIKGKDAFCNGLYDINSNKLKVLAGSKIRKSWSPNFKYYKKRNEQINEYCNVEGNFLILKRDVIFVSPTSAAKFCMGYEVNGQIYWKSTDGLKLKDIIKQSSNR